MLHALSATLECLAGRTLSGPRAPAAALAQRVTNMPLFLWKQIPAKWKITQVFVFLNYSKKTNKNKNMPKSLIYSSPFIIFEFGKMQFIKHVCCNAFRTINENESCFWLVYLTKIKTAANCQRSDQSTAHRTNSNTLSDTVERPTTDLGFLIFADNAMGSLGGVDNILPRQWAGVT